MTPEVSVCIPKPSHPPCAACGSLLQVELSKEPGDARAETSYEAAALQHLMERVVNRDDQALAALYDATINWILALITKIVSDAHVAEEVALNVYHQVWEKAADYSKRRGSVQAWLATMARSRAIDRVRAAAPKNRREVLVGELPETGKELSSSAPSIESGVGKHVLDALEKLPDDQRRAIHLAFYGGLTHHQIAGSLKQPLGTVKTQIRLGMMKLRRILSPSLLEEL